MEDTRIEHDFLGDAAIPADAYWGIHTRRARDNFMLTAVPVNPELIKALAAVKKACAMANRRLGYLPEANAAAICRACDEIMQGQWPEQFPLDALQGGAGTSTNMNLNEVIANRALELLGRKKGDYACVHPVEQVNLHQSTNDVYPTAVRIAAIRQVRRLSEEIAALQGAAQAKEKEFAAIVKIGSTEMQDAVPMTLGAEFSAFAEAFGRDRWRTFKCEERLRVVNIGGTAIGTGIAAPQRYIFLVIEILREITGLGLSRGENLVDATANADPLVETSGILKAHAVNMIKIANDLRLLQMRGEINLPALQTGSSIMPGKVNPVIPESLIQGGITVMANDYRVTEAVSRGSLQLCEFMPLAAHALLESLSILIQGSRMFAPYLERITAVPEQCLARFNRSASIITAFVPVLGYEQATRLFREFSGSGKDNVRDFLIEKLGAEQVNRTLSAQQLMALGYRDHEHNT